MTTKPRDTPDVPESTTRRADPVEGRTTERPTLTRKLEPETVAAGRSAPSTSGTGATTGGGETSTTTRGGRTTTKVERAPEEDAAPESTCVVDDGTRHNGNAVPGTKVCSAHTMHYQNDGTSREENRRNPATPREVRSP